MASHWNAYDWIRFRRVSHLKYLVQRGMARCSSASFPLWGCDVQVVAGLARGFLIHPPEANSRLFKISIDDAARLVALRTLFSSGDRYVHPFGVSDGALIAIYREKCLTLEFEGQSNVQ